MWYQTILFVVPKIETINCGTMEDKINSYQSQEIHIYKYYQ